MAKTILTALDGSEHADKAVEWAIELAAKFGAELVLLYVVPHREAPPELRRMAETEHLVEPSRSVEPPAPSEMADGSRSVLEQITTDSAKIYREIGTRLIEGARGRALAGGVASVATRVEAGDPADRILAVAKQKSADLIVMGSRGRGDLAGLLLGSVSHKVCQLATCACLTVK